MYIYIYIIEYYSAMKMNEVRPFVAQWMQLEIIMPSEVSQKDKCHMVSFICGIWNRAEIILTIKQKQTHRPREKICGCQGGGNGMDGEFEVSKGKLLSGRWIKKQGPAYNTRNYIQ